METRIDRVGGHRPREGAPVAGDPVMGPIMGDLAWQAVQATDRTLSQG